MRAPGTPTTSSRPSWRHGVSSCLRYVDDVNGATGQVAGVVNEHGNVLGLMPHPEHAVDPLLGPTGGRPILTALVESGARARA